MAIVRTIGEIDQTERPKTPKQTKRKKTMKKKKKTQNKRVVITPCTFKTVSFDVVISFPLENIFSP